MKMVDLTMYMNFEYGPCSVTMACNWCCLQFCYKVDVVRIAFSLINILLCFLFAGISALCTVYALCVRNVLLLHIRYKQLFRCQCWHCCCCCCCCFFCCCTYFSLYVYINPIPKYTIYYIKEAGQNISSFQL